MDARFDRLETKLDKLDERLDSIDKTLAVNTSELSVHIKRTNLLESDVKISQQQIQQHIVKVNTVSKILFVLGGILAFVLTTIISMYKVGILS